MYESYNQVSLLKRAEKAVKTSIKMYDAWVVDNWDYTLEVPFEEEYDMYSTHLSVNVEIYQKTDKKVRKDWRIIDPL